MRCQLCGYDDKGTGDFTHACTLTPLHRQGINHTLTRVSRPAVNTEPRLLTVVFDVKRWSNSQVQDLLDDADAKSFVWKDAIAQAVDMVPPTDTHVEEVQVAMRDKCLYAISLLDLPATTMKLVQDTICALEPSE